MADERGVVDAPEAPFGEREGLAGEVVVELVCGRPGGLVADVVEVVSDEEAKERFPGYEAPKPYLRVTPQPQ